MNDLIPSDLLNDWTNDRSRNRPSDLPKEWTTGGSTDLLTEQQFDTKRPTHVVQNFWTNLRPTDPLTVVQGWALPRQFNIINILTHHAQLYILEEGSERGFGNVANSRPPPFAFTYPYDCSLFYNYQPLYVILIHSDVYQSVRRQPPAAFFTYCYGCSRHSRHRSRTTEPSCFALSKHVSFP